MNASIIPVHADDALEVMAGYFEELSETHRDEMIRTINASSYIWVLMLRDKIVGLWGLISPSLLSDQAYLWLYTTKHLDEHVFMFVRHSQRAVEEMLQKYPVIIGHTFADAERSRRWLEWLGAVYGEPMGRVVPFEIRAKS